jgi:hypothetical protein
MASCHSGDKEWEHCLAVVIGREDADDPGLPANRDEALALLQYPVLVDKPSP